MPNVDLRPFMTHWPLIAAITGGWDSAGLGCFPFHSWPPGNICCL